MKGYRTIVFNSIMALIMILSTFGVIAPSETPDDNTVNALLDNLDAVIAAVTVIVNMILRAMTTGPMGTKS